MKKVLCVTMLGLFLLVMFATAQAEETGAIDLSQQHEFETASSLCFMGDTLYILGTYGVYEWKDEQLNTVVDLSESYDYRYMQQRPEDDAEAAMWEKSIGKLFTDGQKLYGLHPYSGSVYEISGGNLLPHAQLPKDLLYVESDEFFREIKGCTYADEKLFLLLGTDDYEDYEKTELFQIDLGKETYEKCSPEGIQSISAGTGQKLLVFIRNDENAIWQYDIKTDALSEKMANLGEQTEIGGLCAYGQDVLYYADNEVKQVHGEQQTVKAYLPVPYAFASAAAACAENGSYAYADGKYVFLRDISGEAASQTVLTVMGDVPYDINIDFSIAHPEIAVVIRPQMGMEQIQQAAISGDSSIDIFSLRVPGMFAVMNEKQYLAPLEGNETLIARAKTLYPAIQNVIFQGNQLMGYPIAINLHAWTINETKWKDIGLGEYPVTYDDLFEQVGKWLEGPAEDYPDYALSDIQQMGMEGVLTQVVDEYILQNEKAGEKICFDTEEFRAILESISSHRDIFSEENDQWGMPLLSSYYMGFGQTSADGDVMTMILPPTVGEKQKLGADIQLLTINAASKQQDAALVYIAYCSEHLSDTLQYEMCPDLNEPIENPRIEKRLAELQVEKEELQKKLESAEDEKRFEIEDRITEVEQMQENVAEDKWLISPESIEIYRAAVENLYIPSMSLANEGNGGRQAISMVISEYGDLKESEIDAFIRELERVVEMVSQEG